MKPTIDSVLAKITKKDEEITRHEQEYAGLIGDLLALCPAKVGDTVDVTDGTYKGKKMLVSSIAVVGNFRGRTPRAFRVTGKIMYKNGKQSSTNGNFEISLKAPTL